MSNGDGFEYTIRRGDALWSIARRYRVDGGWRAIWNHDRNEELRNLRTNPDRLYPGDIVFLPGVEGNVAPTSTGGTTALTVPPPVRIRAEDGRAAPPRYVPAGGTIRLKAIHTRGESGTFAWSTSSTKITLSNQNTDTVTVTGGNNVSASAGAETLSVTFTPDGGSAIPAVSTGLSVIKVSFIAARGQRYGFDDMDNAAGVNPHLSVKKNSTTTVRVRIQGGAVGTILSFTSDDTTTAEATPPATRPAEFDLTVGGKSKNKANTNIKARVDGDTGPVVATLVVNVYREMSYSAKIAKVHDSTSSGTALTRPNFSVTDTQTALRGFYKAAVATINLTDYSSTGGAMDVNFDPTGAGSLVLEAGRVSTGEQRVKNALTGTGKKVVIVKKLSWLFKLGSAAAIGDTTITMSSHLSSGYMAYITNGTYRFGGPGNYENVTVTACNTTTRVVTLSSALTKAHTTSEGIWWPLGGLSGNPAFVQEASDTQAKVNEVIGHELGHEVLRYKDVNRQHCLMHFSNSRNDQKIRFKPLPRYYNPPGGNENQWDCVSRT